MPSRHEIMEIDSKLCNIKLPDSIILKLSAGCLDQDMFSTFDYAQPSLDLKENILRDQSHSIIDFHSKFQISPKLLHKNKADQLIAKDKTENQLKVSHQEASKPFCVQIPYNQIQISEDEPERISMDIMQKDDPKFTIPNEGNINKSPLSLLTKATRTNVFCINNSGGREKSLSFNNYSKIGNDNALTVVKQPQIKDEDDINKISEMQRTTTPQQKHNLYSNLIEKRNSNFDSQNQKFLNKKIQKFTEGSEGWTFKPTYSKRSQTIKERYKTDHEFHFLHKARLPENPPRMIAKIRQSPEMGTLTEHEDFGFNDIDEQVTSHKKSLLQRNIDWKNDSNLKIKFPDLSDKDNGSFKESISKFQKQHLIPKRNKIVSSTGLSSHGVETEILREKHRKRNQYQPPKYTVITHVGENKGENINECQVIKDNDSQEQSPENLKISGEYRDKFKNSDVFYIINPTKASLPDQVTRNSNPIKLSKIDTQIDQQINEINKISESPEYKNSRYTLAAYKNTLANMQTKIDEIEEYNLYESPQEGSLERSQCIIINASGNKKNPSRDYNKIKASLSHTSRMQIELDQGRHLIITNEDLSNKPFPKRLESNYQPKKERLHRKKQHNITNSLNLNNRNYASK